MVAHGGPLYFRLEVGNCWFWQRIGRAAPCPVSPLLVQRMTRKRWAEPGCAELLALL